MSSPSSGTTGSPQSQTQSQTQTQRRGRTYLKIILILIIQAIVVPWFVMEQGEDVYNSTGGGIRSQNTGNPPPSLLLRSSNNNKGNSNINNRDTNKEEEEADGTFNSFPIYYLKKKKKKKKKKEQSPSPSLLHYYSNVHCIGDTHNPQTSWMYRSCQFHNLCINTTSKEFVFIESPTLHNLHTKTQAQLNNHNNSTNNGNGNGGFFSSTVAGGGNVNNSTLENNNNNNNMAMALGGINPRWDGNGFNQGRHKVKWFPKTQTQIVQESLPYNIIYELDPDIILLPFHSFAAHNVGHLLWDDFLPIFTLLEIFDFISPQLSLQQQQSKQSKHSKQLLLLRVDTLPLLYGTCEMRKKKQQKCQQNFLKFLPLLGIKNPDEQFTTLKNIRFVVKPTSVQPKEGASSSSTSSLVCAKTAIAGLGMLTDHGMNDHGWYPETDTKRGHNTAKGQLLYRFRNFMLTNIGLPIVPPSLDDDNGQQQQFRILLSQHSSDDGPRDVSMENQYNAIQRAFPPPPPRPTTTTTTTAAAAAAITTRVVNLATIQSLEEQILLVSQTNIFISTTGGGSMTATFLPKGSTLILFYQKSGGFDFHNFNFTGGPAYLDYDLFNNMSYIRVHWLPIETMDTKEGLDTLISLIQYEMEVYYDNNS